MSEMKINPRKPLPEMPEKPDLMEPEETNLQHHHDVLESHHEHHEHHHAVHEMHDAALRDHHDRMIEIEKRLGISHKSDGFKSEDQEERKEPHYGRKRH